MTEALEQIQAAQPRRFRPYPETRNSGVVWLGGIPSHWTVKPFKALLSRNDSGVWGEDALNEGSVVLRSTEQTVDGEWSINTPALRLLTAREAAHARLEVGDLVVTKSSGSELHIGKTSIVDQQVADMHCAFSNFMQRLRVSSGQEPRFYWYLMNVPVAREQFVFLSSTTTGLGNLNGSILGAIRVPVAPPREQRSVVAFLDRETEKIDGLIAKKERLIALLQEKRTALITHAVTRGLDPNVSMKDSGVEWLGEIPAHWEVKRLKYLVPGVTVGIVVTPSKYYVPEGVPCLRSLNISRGRVTMEDLVYISEEANELHRKSKIFEGDVVVVRTGQAGTAAVVPEILDGVNCIDLLIVRRSTRIRSQLVYYYLNSPAAISQAAERSVGAIQAHYNTSTLAELVVPEIPLAEQQRIVSHLDNATRAIDRLAAKITDGVDLLREFRTALISAAVTGKIDVREVSE